MDGTHQPTELHAGHDVLHALESLAGTGPVIKEQQNAGADLDAKEKEGDATQEIPVRQIVGGDSFLSQGSGEGGPVESFVHPVAQDGKQAYASRFRDHHVVAAQVDFIRLEWPRRRTRNVAAS